MSNLLIFFIFPLATIIISIVLERAINSPISVAAFVFALALVITFIAYSPAELIYAIIYTIISYIVAVLTCLIIKSCKVDAGDDNEENNDSNNSVCDCMRNSEQIGINNQMSYGCNMRGRRM